MATKNKKEEKKVEKTGLSKGAKKEAKRQTCFAKRRENGTAYVYSKERAEEKRKAFLAGKDVPGMARVPVIVNGSSAYRVMMVANLGGKRGRDTEFAKMKRRMDILTRTMAKTAAAEKRKKAAGTK